MPTEQLPRFRLFSASDEHILAECSSCGRVLKIAWSAAERRDGGGFDLIPEVRCPCGRSADSVLPSAPRGPSRPRATSQSAAVSAVKCLKCGSDQFAAGTKGFGLGKAAAGGLLLGPVGLLGGLVGCKKVRVTCLRCGNTWVPKR